MINLLPSHQKEELREKESLKVVLILGIVILTFLLSLTLILFSIRTVLFGQRESQKILFEQKEKEWHSLPIRDLEKEIQDYNLRLAQLETFYAKELNLTEVLEKIYDALPEGAYLNVFNFDLSQFQVFLSGFSPTREALLEFKKGLEGQKEFSEIHFPPANWIKPTDIDFSVNFKLKK